MAKYDYGGGCACGLYRECNCVNSWPRTKQLEKKIEEKEKELASLRKELNYARKE